MYMYLQLYLVDQQCLHRYIGLFYMYSLLGWFILLG